MEKITEFGRQNTYIKGTKKAFARAPHRLLGSKSIEDRIVIEWTKDFETAEHALDMISDETKALVKNWKAMLDHQESIARVFVDLYKPIQEENLYRATQETPLSSTRAVNGLTQAIEEARVDIETELTMQERSTVAKIKSAKESVESIQKTIRKREHKKVDWDRANNAVEKQTKKTNATEKEQQHLARLEMELDQALELFQAYDEKLKRTVPYFLNSLSEFLNGLTAALYMSQQRATEILKAKLYEFCRDQGLLNRGGTGIEEYVEIVEEWETRFVSIQPRCEQGLSTLRQGKVAGTPMTLPSKKAYEQVFHKATDSAETLATKVAGRIRHPTRKSQIQFSSPSQGMFRSESDLPTLSTRSFSSSTGGGPLSPMQSPGMSSRALSPVLGRYPDTGNALDSFITSTATTRVRALSSSSAQALSINGDYVPPRSDKDEYANALYTFAGNEPGDVGFRRGDRIRVLDHGDETDDMWWFGETDDGRVGLFPCNYVEVKH